MRYRRLRECALQLTGNDRVQAEDLIQDAFVHFTLARPDLDTLYNLDGYLYRMLRNLHVSETRRRARLQSQSLRAVDFDSAELVLRTVNPENLIRAQDELRLICRYACIRKDSSKAGSVLALRFLHGYYPQEIADFMRSSRQAVEERLRVARIEAKNYLDNPGALSFMHGSTPVLENSIGMNTGFVQLTDELLADLRRMIFAVRQGECATGEQLNALYNKQDANGINCATLSHLVSCPQCLDAVNQLLDLPPLAERYPVDMLGNDNRNKEKRPPRSGNGSGSGGDDGASGTGANGSGTSGTGASGEAERRCRRRARAVFEHRPQELRICLNGYTAAAARVTSELCQHTINTNESIEFVEVFSEQEVRLLFIPRDEMLGGEEWRQPVTLSLSDNRSLQVVIAESGAQTAVHVTYQDPLLCFDAAKAETPSAEPLSLTEEQAASSATIEDKTRPKVSTSYIWQRLWQWVAAQLLQLRPLTAATASLLVIALIATLLVRTLVPVASAAELLRHAAVIEETAKRNPYFVQHRTLLLEEREGDGGKLIARRKIEVWQSASRKIEARRIYTEQGELIAGEWTNDDGSSVTYHTGAEPEFSKSSQPQLPVLLRDGEAWRLDATAQGFVNLIGGTDAASVEEAGENYVFKYEPRNPGDQPSLLRAQLMLKRSDLTPLEETFLVATVGGTREFKLIVSEHRQRFVYEVNPSVFIPEPKLRGAFGQAANQGKMESPITESGKPPNAVNESTPAIVRASAELEIEVTYLLNEIKANLGEQVSLTRRADGALLVEALVETGARKEEILRALDSVHHNPAIVLNVRTITEATKLKRDGALPLIEREVEATSGQMPAFAELRRNLQSQGKEATEQEVAGLADRIMNRARQAVLHASALQRLVKRFPAREVEALAPDARDKWQRMIREHAQSYRREVDSLRRELRSVFPGLPASDSTKTVTGINDASKAAAHLLQLSYTHDDAVRAAFTVSVDGRTAAVIKSPAFWSSLTTAEKLCAAIQENYRK